MQEGKITSIKLTAQEIEDIMEIKRKWGEITLSLGNIELEKNLLLKRIEELDNEKENKMKEIEETRENEKKLLNKFYTKYGQGSINLETGEYILSDTNTK